MNEDSMYYQLFHKKDELIEYLDAGDSASDVIRFLGPINKVNIFIGPNNVRKSRFLRSLMSFDSFLQVSQKFGIILDNFNQIINRILKTLKDNNLQTSQFIIDITTQRDIAIQNSDRLPNEILELLKSINANKNRIQINYNFFEQLKNEINDILTDIERAPNTNLEELVKETISIIAYIQKFDTFEKFPDKYFREVIRITEVANLSIIDQELIELNEVLAKLYGFQYNFQSPNKVYIPLLRSALTLYENKSHEQNKKISYNLFENTIRTNYNLQETEKIKIFTGEDLYKNIKSNRNDRRSIRKKFEQFEKFINDNFFKDNPIDIVAKESENDKEQHIQIYSKGDDDKFLYDLGDGIQSLIIMFYPIFMAEKNSYIFIEEPEINLHPGLINIFIRTLFLNETLNKMNLRFFLSTHSNHLLNLSIENSEDISVFRFEKKSHGKTTIKNVSGPDVELLEILGVFNSSVFIANSTIWVEGVSDRKILSSFLKAYINDSEKHEYIEGLNYSFFEYAGTNLEHYIFNTKLDEANNKIRAHFLSNKIFLLVDSDDSPTKDEKYNQLKKLEKTDNSSFYFETTEAIEIENILSLEILKSFLLSIDKITQEVINRLRFTEESYESKRLGAYLFDRLKGKVDNIPKFYDANGTGTLTAYYKNKLSNFIVDNIDNENITWDIISQNKHAKRIIERLYEFIEKNNAIK